jgi:cbb3-type cytochrome oxidase subunit 1
MATLLHSEQDSAARRHLLAAVAFLLVGAAVGLAAIIKLSYPSVFDAAGFASYARLRPMAFNLLVHGFGFLFVSSITYYLIPRLTGERLPFEWLANANLAGMAGVVTLGVLGIGAGFNSGGDLAEFGIVLDILFFLGSLIPAAIASLALIRRRENTIYPSLAFAVAASFIYPWLYLVGNLWAVFGVGTQLQNTFMVGGLFGFVFPAAGFAAVYYLVPKESDQPLYSRPLANAGLWTLLFTGLSVGQARFVAGPSPDWLDTVGAVLSLGLLIAALTLAANVWYTLQGAWDRVAESPALRLTIAGVAAHVVLAVLFGVQGFRAVAAIVGLTIWYDVLMLTTLLGSMTLFAAGFAYHAYPRMSGRDVFSGEAAGRHLRLTLWGMGLFLVLGVIAGLVTGMTWASNVVSGAAANTGEGFRTSMGGVRTLLIVANLPLLAGVAGVVGFAANLYRTVTSGAVTTSELLMEVGE